MQRPKKTSTVVISYPIARISSSLISGLFSNWSHMIRRQVAARRGFFVLAIFIRFICSAWVAFVQWQTQGRTKRGYLRTRVVRMWIRIADLHWNSGRGRHDARFRYILMLNPIARPFAWFILFPGLFLVNTPDLGFQHYSAQTLMIWPRRKMLEMSWHPKFRTFGWFLNSSASSPDCVVTVTLENCVSSLEIDPASRALAMKADLAKWAPLRAPFLSLQ